MTRPPNAWLAFWFATTVIGFAVSLALARSSVQEVVVAAVGLMVAAIVFASCLTAFARVAREPESGWEPVDRPLVLLLIAAFLSFGFAVVFWFFVDKSYGLFVGLWVPSILSLAATLRAGRR
ncbi:MAG TPA: hypothetical protein VLK35_08250 [Methylomirabilota bacterium]|nr:hypothetical protein [Methylomirabilota bacterium]